MPTEQRLKANGPKKLLALDGGGIRGVMTIEVLAAIEDLLRKKTGAGPDFVLGDYFDYVAGTSTGAIIATCIALGMPMAEIRKFYHDNGTAMFDKAGLLNRYRYKFEDDKLAATLQKVMRGQIEKVLGRKATDADLTLGTEALRSLVLIVMRNATTDSPWPLSNNPKAKYNDPNRKDCNLGVPLWQLVRASTAAPTYFPPEVVQFGDNKFIMVDGGVTMYNNPAFLVFLMATVEPYNLNWKAGEKDMLVVSVGTGSNASANKDLEPGEMNLLYNASSIPSALMFAALNEQDMLCRVFGNCKNGAAIDSEMGDLCGVKGPVAPKLFTYVRYNAELSRKGLDDLGLKNIQPEQVQKLDSVQFIPQLAQVGQAVAKAQLKEAHFDGFV